MMASITGSHIALVFVGLLGAMGLVVADPLFGTYSKGRAYLVTYRLGRAGMVAAILAVVMVPPLLALSLVVAVSRAGSFLAGLVAGLFAGIAAAGFIVNLGGRKPGPIRLTTVMLGAGTLATVAGLLALQPWLFLLGAPLAVLVVVSAIRFWITVGTRVSNVPGGAVREETSPVAHRVVMMIFDEFPLSAVTSESGKIDAVRFPNLARLAAQSIWYRNMTSTSPETRVAVPTILSGKFAQEAQLPTQREHPVNLFSLLGRHYAINAHESLTWMAPNGARRWRRNGLVRFLRQSARLAFIHNMPTRHAGDWFGDRFLFAEAPDAMERFIESLQSSEQPVFDFIHVLLPHRPWRLNDEANDYGDQGLTSGVHLENIADVMQARQRLLLQCQAVDHYLGRVLDRLEGLGELETSLVVVTSDHGVTVRARHGFRVLDEDSYADVLWVPALVKKPGAHLGEIDDRPHVTADLFPIVLTAAGIDVPTEIDGTLERSVASARTVGFHHDAFAFTARTVEEQARFDRAEGLRRIVSEGRFADADPFAAYRIGPLGELVGREIPASARVAPARRGNFGPSKRDRTSRWFAAGTIESRGDEWVVVAHDGVVCGTGPAVGSDDGAARWSAVLCPDFVGPVSGKVELFVGSAPDKLAPTTVL